MKIENSPGPISFSICYNITSNCILANCVCAVLRFWFGFIDGMRQPAVQHHLAGTNWLVQASGANFAFKAFSMIHQHNANRHDEKIFLEATPSSQIFEGHENRYHFQPMLSVHRQRRMQSVLEMPTMSHTNRRHHLTVYTVCVLGLPAVRPCF